MNGRIERLTPREDFLIAMFQDDSRLVDELRNSKSRVNWWPLYGLALLAIVSILGWSGVIYVALHAKGWLQLWMH